jgi:mono/diheme cytochrome c family protein
MNSSQLSTIHIIVVTLFLLIYLVKTILIFTNQNALQKFVKATRVLEMVVSTLFLITGIWLFVILKAIKVLHIIKLVLIFISIPLAITGYKRMNKALALISFLFIIAAYGLAEAAKNKPFIPIKVIVEGNADESQLGVKTFAANCSMCHGMDGKKMYRDAADLSLSYADPVRIDTLIRNGSKGKMPAFNTTLSNEEINAAASYIQNLRGK